MVFMGISGITFDDLGLHVEVSRAAKSACVLNLDHSLAIGVLDRTTTRHVDWKPTHPEYKLPAEILNIVGTMI